MNVMRSLAELLPSEALSDESVVRPGGTEEVAAVMAWASRERIGVLPMGGRDWPRAVLTDRPWIALSTDRLSGIEIYEPADLTITAGAGSSFHQIDATLRDNRQWLPFDPPHAGDRSLGGLVARGVSGPLWMGYGALRNHVLGATVVSGDGRTLTLGGRVVKNVAGFDLLRPMVGSRGALGVITSVCLRAFPVPHTDRVLVLRGRDFGELAAVALRVSTAPVLPVSSTLADDLLHGAALQGPALVVRLHGAEETVDADQETLERHAGVRFSSVDDADEVLTTVRDRAAGQEVVVDASARPSRLAEALRALDRLKPTALVADGYSGRVRVGLDGLDEAAFGAVCADLEKLGGAVRIAESRTAPELLGNGTRPRSHEQQLERRLRTIFDPHEVLWPSWNSATS